jgi:hypothetical protein
MDDDGMEKGVRCQVSDFSPASGAEAANLIKRETDERPTSNVE